VGRPSKLTPAIHDKIVGAVRMGNYRRAAGAYAGIGETTLTTWMKRGKASPRSVHGRFRAAVLEAEAAAEIEAVGFIRKAAQGDWKAALAWLERKRPDHWLRQERLRVVDETPGGQGFDPVGARRLVEVLGRRLAASGEDSGLLAGILEEKPGGNGSAKEHHGNGADSRGA